MFIERLISLSLANFLLLGSWIVFLHDGSLYQLRETPERTFTALFSVLLTLALLAELIFWARRRIEKASNTVKGLFYGILFLVLLIPFNQMRTEIGINWRIPVFVSEFIRVSPVWKLLLLGLCLLVPYLWGCTKIGSKMSRWIRITSLILMPALFVCVANGVWACNKSPVFVIRPKPTRLNKIEGEPARVLWLLFDELDQRLVFEERPRGIEYPEFDRFVHGAVGVHRAFSPGPNTIESIPGLLIGEDVVAAQSVFPADVYLTFKKDGRHILWSKQETIYAQLEKEGFHTGLLGWYHAYCAILWDDVDLCERRSHFRYTPNILENIPIILRNALYGKWVVALFLDGVKDLGKAAMVLSSNKALDFAFIHLPVPHGPWVYNRVQKHTTLFISQSPAGYFDNVAYADKLLGDIRKSMEEANVWNRTTVILSTDHSWRSSALYDNKRDERVPFYVKMPDEGHQTVEGPFRTRNTSKLVLDILNKRVTTSKELSTWLQKASTEN